MESFMRLGTCSIGAIVVCLAATGTASAITRRDVQSTQLSFSARGYQWNISSDILNVAGPNATDGMGGDTYVGFTGPGFPIPASITFNAETQLFAANGQLCKDVTNATVVDGIEVTASTGDVTATCTGAQTFFERGYAHVTSSGVTITATGSATKCVTRSGTVTSGCNANSAATPAAARDETSATIRVNAKGQTYGSAGNVADQSSQPDLILASGPGDLTGYVVKADLYASGTPRRIPLYNQDGSTVIGSFSVG